MVGRRKRYLKYAITALSITTLLLSLRVYFHSDLRPLNKPYAAFQSATPLLAQFHFLNCTLLRYNRPNFNATCLWDALEETALVPFALLKELTDVSREKHQLPLDAVAGVEPQPDQPEIFENFHFQISYSNPDKWIPNASVPYTLASEFTNFGNYRVDLRDRVKCIDTLLNLCVSTQWDKAGYLYPTQIAQQALSLYSRWSSPAEFLVTGPNPKLYFNMLDLSKGPVSVEEQSPVPTAAPHIYALTADDLRDFNFTEPVTFQSHLFSILLSADSDSENHIHGICSRSHSNPLKSSVTLEVRTSSPSLQIYLTYNIVRCYKPQSVKKCSAKIFLQNPKIDHSKPIIATLEIVIPVFVPPVPQEPDDSKNTHQRPGDVDPEFFSYGLHRNIRGDVIKYLLGFAGSPIRNSLFNTTKMVKSSTLKLRIETIVSIRTNEISQPASNIWARVSQRPELELFWKSVDFLKGGFDENGGYSMPIKRKVTGYDDLEPGWYSAMSQGQGMSAIARAHWLSKDPRYFKDLLSLMQPFKARSEDGGVKNYIFDHFVWYEEYPMQPNGQFVLNGFMYSLAGLFDAMLACSKDTQNPVAKECLQLSRQLFCDGLASLYQMLPLYDNGFGSFYDLRHTFSAENISPNRARWDYHTVHILLLRFLIHVLQDKPRALGPGLENGSDVLEKWVSYRPLLTQTDWEVDQYLERFETIKDRWVEYADGVFSKHN